MVVVCGQCGKVHEHEAPLGDSVVCAACRHEISLAAPPAEDSPAGATLPPKDPAADGGFAELARKAKHRKISIACSACGKTVHLSARVAGKAARCKACGENIQVPYPDDLAAFKAPAVLPRPDEIVEGEKLLPGPEEMADQEAPPPAPEPVAVAVAMLEGEPASPIELDTPHREDIVGAVDEYAADLDAGYSANQDELASVLADLKQESVTQGRIPTARKTGDRKLLYIAAVAVAILVPVVAVYVVMNHIRPNQAAVANQGGDANGEPATVAPGPTTTATQTPATSVAVATRRAAPVASCTVADSLSSAFAAGGYFPARSDSLYTQIKVRLQAGEKPLRLQPGVNTDFVLAVNGRNIPCLGVPAESDEGLPQRSRVEDIRIAAGGAREVILLFEVPRDASEGLLRVRDVGEAKVPLDGPPAAIPAARLAGTYAETPPRNLRPLLRHPVMAAIQAAVGQKLIVKAEGRDLRVEIPEAAVAGTARAAGPGLFRANLSCGGSDLACTLRFLGGGSMVLLYLDEAPFHQITYSRAGGGSTSHAPKATAPSTGAATRPATTRPRRPNPVGPDLWPDKKPMSTYPPGYDPNAKVDPKDARDLPRGKSWFD